LHAIEAADTADREEITPAAVDERWNRNRAPSLLDIDRGPVVIVIGMFKPLVVVRREGTEFLKAGKRNLLTPAGEYLPLSSREIFIGSFPRLLGGCSLCDQLPSIRVGCEEVQQPALGEPEIEHTVHVCPVIMIIGRCLPGGNGNEVWGRGDRRL